MHISKANQKLLIEQKFIETKFKKKEIENDVFSCVAYGKEFSDQRDILACIYHGFMYEKKITKLLNKYADFYNEVEVDETDFGIELNKEKGPGVFFTNMADKKLRDVVVFGSSFEGGALVKRNKDKYIEEVNDKIVYTLRPSKWSSSNLVIERNKEKIMVLALNKTRSLKVKGDNHSDVVLDGNNQITFVYRKSYIESLKGKEPNPEKCLAFFQWDIVDEKDLPFISSLNFYDIDFDKDEELFSLIFLLAMAPGFIYKNQIVSSLLMGVAVTGIGARMATMRH